MDCMFQFASRPNPIKSTGRVLHDMDFYCDDLSPVPSEDRNLSGRVGPEYSKNWNQFWKQRIPTINSLGLGLRSISECSQQDRSQELICVGVLEEFFPF